MHNETANVLSACARIVEASTKSCSLQAVPQAQTPASGPNWDAMANSFASLSTAFTWGSILLAFVGILAGLAWGYFVAIRAENEARTAAKRYAHEIINDWLAKEAPAIIRAHVENLRSPTLGDENDDDSAADALGEAAG
jgi:hypothetical protein